ncbi:Hydroxyacylglutathione hydrolase [uncultured archaeon]|nr:Hydroxyacylglutathione hydrolase [uncultured archaeon]
MPQVFLLKPGSILRDASGNILDARSSVTLVISGKTKMIVDTGQEGEEEKVLSALKSLDLRPKDIDTLINTHSHPDHCGNNRLFSGARILSPTEGVVIAPGVWIIETPGHSMDSISVAIKGPELVVIAGDALPTFGNFQKNVPPAMHINRDLAVSSMAKIVAVADIVVPGHDFPFYVPEREYVRHSDIPARIDRD